MIVFKDLRWSGAFSYGDNNTLQLNAEPLTQIIGKNGHGKSSIPAILEEVLYNKNSKGIKKADILNRNISDKSYSIELDLEVDGVSYTINTVRGSTQTVKLMRGNEDISAHTSTGTYKLIESIIGYDHKTFTQIVYQSNASSLEFLTATDTNRKKFLIELLNLSKYTRAAEVFKDLAKETSTEIVGIKSKLETTSNWLSKLNKEPILDIQEVEVPEAPDNLIKQVSRLEGEIANLESTKKAIVQNQQYKSILDSIELLVVSVPSTDLQAITKSKIEAELRLKDLKAKGKSHEHKAGIRVCPTCSQAINTSTSEQLLKATLEEIIVQEGVVSNISKEYLVAVEEHSKYTKAMKAQEEWEKYHRLYNPELPAATKNFQELHQELSSIQETIRNINASISKAINHNKAVEANNAKIAMIKEQKAQLAVEQAEYTSKLLDKEKLLATRQTLTKTFSTTGLVAYKLECLVTDLEDLTNKYLVDLSDGRFQLEFRIAGADKLNVVIIDNGQDVDITALSGGELARVNVSTLLAIRKLMQSISNNRTNLLILDETIDSLDADGKEKLVDILLAEEYLNTFIVSHGFQHPLLAKINIVKENNISRIE